MDACKMEEDQSVSTHVWKMKSFIDRLERLGHPMSRVLVVNTNLGSLPKSFDNFVMNYNMQGWDKTLGELHATLKIVEKNVSSKSAVPSLHMIRDRGVKKKT
ncbi:zinc finger, CCHC-type [Artemisia annua]|uniref:Zinc finger, CCHC-type n=1 Tax=Artemisia annua TaxID=35608 RepID=A0A2U1M3H4_ARTAN|nr:zinc finger, CCHC-type [Artemisia annua]